MMVAIFFAGKPCDPASLPESPKGLGQAVGSHLALLLNVLLDDVILLVIVAPDPLQIWVIITWSLCLPRESTGQLPS